jgi:hypothetical protein
MEDDKKLKKIRHGSPMGAGLWIWEGKFANKIDPVLKNKPNSGQVK